MAMHPTNSTVRPRLRAPYVACASHPIAGSVSAASRNTVEVGSGTARTVVIAARVASRTQGAAHICNSAFWATWPGRGRLREAHK